MLKAKAQEIIKGYWQAVVIDGDHEHVAFYAPGWKTRKGAENWIIKHGYELTK